MSQQIELAKGRLYGAGAINVRNLKLFPGSKRDVTSEQIADEINKSIAQISTGEYELVEQTED